MKEIKNKLKVFYVNFSSGALFRKFTYNYNVKKKLKY